MTKKTDKSEEAKKEKKYFLKEKIANVLDMSKEIILDAAKINFIGNKEVMIENYRAIVEYSEKTIKIRAPRDLIKIKGKNLEIKTITQDMLYITGYIDSLEFSK